MIKVNYTELDGPYGPAMRLEAAGHAGYAPAGQDIVCAGVSTLMQALVSLLAGEENAHSDAFDEPDGPRLTVTAARPCTAWVEGAFELAKAGFRGLPAPFAGKTPAPPGASWPPRQPSAGAGLPQPGFPGNVLAAQGGAVHVPALLPP